MIIVAVIWNWSYRVGFSDFLKFQMTSLYLFKIMIFVAYANIGWEIAHQLHIKKGITFLVTLL